MESATTDEDQRDWPSFSDILAELKALDRLSTSPLAIDNFHAEATSDRDEHDEPDSLVEATAEKDIQGTDDVGTTEHDVDVEVEADQVEVETHDDVAEDVAELGIVEAPVGEMAPSELDTSVLDEPLEVNLPEIDFDPELLGALDPIDVVEDSIAEAVESAPAPEVEAVPEDEPAVWLADDFDATGSDLEWAHVEPGSVFDVDTDVVAADVDDAPDDDPFADIAPEEDLVAQESAAADGGADEEFTSTEWADALDAELAPPAIEGVGADSAAITTADFDSVATADAIENDLSDLFELDPGEEKSAEVVPLRGKTGDTSSALVGLDDELEGERESTFAPVEEVEPEAEDPWAYMRPDDEPEAKKSFWANRPKFFGGDERKRRRAERQATENEEQTIVPGPDCPSCGEEGQVDLDDPVGRRVHASCDACDHVWSAAYDEQDAQAS
ncbi:MAG: hypothetical protein ACR2P0_15055 [Acidimicrobiales bacterium]